MTPTHRRCILAGVIGAPVLWVLTSLFIFALVPEGATP